MRPPASKRPRLAGPGHGRPRQQQDRRSCRHLPGQRDRPARVGGGADRPVRLALDVCAARRGQGGRRRAPGAHQRLQVKQAPNIEPDGQLSAAEEAELYRHYGLDYDTVTLDNGAPADQTLAEPAGQTHKPERTDQAGATATHIPEPASSAAGGLADTGWTSSPRPRRLRPGAPTWTEPDTSLLESEQDRRGAYDERRPPSASRLNPPGKTGSRGRGGSRPFVYETPGRPEGGAGTRQRQQVRLRRYLVTEVVTETEAGQRHESGSKASRSPMPRSTPCVRPRTGRTSRSVRTRTGLVTMTGSVMKATRGAEQAIRVCPHAISGLGQSLAGMVGSGRRPWSMLSLVVGPTSSAAPGRAGPSRGPRLRSVLLAFAILGEVQRQDLARISRSSWSDAMSTA